MILLCEVSGTVPPLSPSRIWKTLRRDIKRGYSAAYHDHRTLSRIDSWQWPYWGEKSHAIPVHIIAGEEDWRMAAWTLASWFCATDLGWPVVIHDDGTLSNEACDTLRELFGVNLIIVSRAEADPAMDVLLKAFPFCDEYRRAHSIRPLDAHGLLERLPQALRARAELVEDWTNPATFFDAVICHGNHEELASVSLSLAQRQGPIVSLTALRPGDQQVPLERLVVERALSVNTAAAGGNASLMTIG